MVMAMFAQLPAETRKLWKITGAIFTAGWVFKFGLWKMTEDQVVKGQDYVHQKSLRDLQRARENAKKWDLPSKAEQN
eukprot:CAMPEP_0117764908 /NCGR_PEP_ID=MMETSP0947-20121206/19741_1 /TAXON_ID=44440 /ORGANISM="Chattonella subsalsa, Strain CCMP2191" /LENGTH=76 /DNA_ID=CAMNT_0005587351 /DNA_START=102 /DNA_END=332 /DNA_ORIENTATION=+